MQLLTWSVFVTFASNPCLFMSIYTFFFEGLQRRIESPVLCLSKFALSSRSFSSVQFSSVAQSCPTLQPRELQHARPPCPSPTPGVYPNPCPFSCWCHPIISSSVIPFSSCPQSFSASGSFQMSQLFTSADQILEFQLQHHPSTSSNQDWSPLGWTGWISLQTRGLSTVFSNTTVQKHQFFCTQLSL